MNPENSTPKLSQCSTCSNTLLKNESKLLKCLHGVCAKCLVLQRSDSGVKCMVCKSVSYGDLINYPIIPLKLENCKKNNCHQEAVNMCKICFKVFCKSCSVDHKQTDSKHQKHINLFQTLQNEIILCPNCSNTANIWCTQCSTIHCGFCHAENHKEHNYTSLEKMKDKQRCEIISIKDDLLLNSKCIEKYVDLTESHISKLQKNHNTVMIKIEKQWEIISKELMHCKQQINERLEKLLQERVSEATKHKLALKTLEAKNEYNTNFASSVLDNNKNMNDFRLVKILKDEQNRIKSCIKYNTPKLLCNINPKSSITDIINSSDKILKTIRSTEKLNSPSNIDLPNNFGTVMPIENIEAQKENDMDDKTLETPSFNLDKVKEDNILPTTEINKNLSINKESMEMECIVLSDDDNEPQKENGMEDKILETPSSNSDKVKEENISPTTAISRYKNLTINKESMEMECIVLSDDDNEAQKENCMENKTLEIPSSNSDKVKEENISPTTEISLYKNVSINKESIEMECIVLSDDDNEVSYNLENNQMSIDSSESNNLAIPEENIITLSPRMANSKISNQGSSMEIDNLITDNENQKTNLHIQTLTPHTGKRQFQCKICKKSFSQNHKLNLHMVVIHANGRQYKCTACKKSFSKRSIFKVHMLNHTEETSNKLHVSMFVKKNTFS